MRTKLIEFLLDKKSKGLPMNIGEAMSVLNITHDEGGPMGKQVIVFRQEWEDLFEKYLEQGYSEEEAAKLVEEEFQMLYL